MKYLLFFCILLFQNGFSQTSWYDESITGSVVLLEKEVNNHLVPHGTGFMLYSYDSPNTVYLVTCEHVLRNSSIYVKIPADSSIIKTMDSEKKKILFFGDLMWVLDGKNLIQKINLIKDSTFFLSDDLDIGIIKINAIGKLISKKDSTITNVMKYKSIPKSLIGSRKNTSLGEEIFFLGFPLYIGTELGFYAQGLYADETANPLLRTGTIAYISPNSKEFLIDAFSYSGNSGGPVFTRPGLDNPSPKLIGMITAHLPSEKSENIGLANAIWIDDILKVIEKIKNKKGYKNP